MSASKLFENVANSRGNISLEVEPDELLVIVQFLKASKDAFINLAAEAMDKNEATKFDDMSNYAKVAEKLHSRFGIIAAIGEPESKLLN